MKGSACGCADVGWVGAIAQTHQKLHKRWVSLRAKQLHFNLAILQKLN